MKERLMPLLKASLVVIWLVLPTSSHSQAQTDICKDAQTTYGLRNCFDAALKTEQERLVALQAQIRAVLTETQRKALVEADNAWLKYRDRDCRASALRYEGGSIEPVVELTCRYELTKQRIQALEQDYKNRLKQ